MKLIAMCLCAILCFVACGSKGSSSSGDFFSDASSAKVQVVEFLDPGSENPTTYRLGLEFKSAPMVGLNPIVLTLHAIVNEVTTIPIEDAMFALTPQMPSMGHGAPGSVNPVFISAGYYEGMLAFSMLGMWETTIVIARVGKGEIGRAIFQTEF
jgi:hypothetical protein